MLSKQVLSKKSLPALRKLAEKYGVIGYRKLSKAELEDRIYKVPNTYLEDMLFRRIRLDILPKYHGLKAPGRNKTHLVGSRLTFDFSWKSIKVAIEVQGGIDCRTRRSGHVSRTGMRNDMRKVCLSSIQGWVLLQLSPEQVNDPETWSTQTLTLICQAIDTGISRVRTVLCSDESSDS